MNNNYDRDITPDTLMNAEQAGSRQAALNVLGLIQQRQHMRRMREQAIRAQYIPPTDITG
jgi:hypothetical protein